MNETTATYEPRRTGPGECWDRSRTPSTTCRGKCQWRTSTGGTTRVWRCEAHHLDALDQAAKIRDRYPDTPTPPAWFDPADAGERWDDDY